MSTEYSFKLKVDKYATYKGNELVHARDKAVADMAAKISAMDKHINEVKDAEFKAIQAIYHCWTRPVPGTTDWKVFRKLVNPQAFESYNAKWNDHIYSTEMHDLVARKGGVVCTKHCGGRVVVDKTLCSDHDWTRLKDGQPPRSLLAKVENGTINFVVDPILVDAKTAWMWGVRGESTLDKWLDACEWQMQRRYNAKDSYTKDNREVLLHYINEMCKPLDHQLPETEKTEDSTAKIENFMKAYRALSTDEWKVALNMALEEASKS